MAYGKKKKNNIFTSLKFRFARMIVSNFPLNSVRVWGLKLLGFKVGKHVYVGSGLMLTMFNSKSNCELIIGDRVAIAPRVTLILASDANWSRLNEIIPPVEGKIELKNDCWLGAGVFVMPNVTVGEMAVVATGSVVTKNVSPYTVVAGVPAKVIKTLQTKTQV
ncbi:MAG: acyltransferase [Chitinophagaceae bacterium]|nr:MAG: acyltransferase [Chitinophagaceae bacterium]